jgi:hypothetical protein
LFDKNRRTIEEVSNNYRTTIEQQAWVEHAWREAGARLWRTYRQTIRKSIGSAKEERRRSEGRPKEDRRRSEGGAKEERRKTEGGPKEAPAQLLAVAG